MPDFRQRHPGPELLDGPHIPKEDIQQNMRELAFINTWLGGHAINLAGWKKFCHRWPQKTHWHIAEVGCGAGDNLNHLSKAGTKQGVIIQSTGIDINPHAIQLARQQLDHVGFNWIQSDYRDVFFADSDKPDIIFASLCCHHFDESDLLHLLQWMRDYAKYGFFINDLHRHPLAYFSIRILTQLCSRSYLVKHDAPLSVLRGFTRNEWNKFLQEAGIQAPSIQWKWAFRHLITVLHER